MNLSELASEYMIRAVNIGYNDFENIRKDEAFSQINNTPVFQNTIDEIENYGKRFGETEYIEATKLVKCHVQFPENYNSEEKYSLVIGMHGSGGSAHGFINYHKLFVENGFVFAAPQGAYLKQQTNGKLAPRYSWGIQIKDEELWKKGDPYSVQHISNVALHLKEKHKIKNVYLMGFSQGAGFAYLAGLKNPEMYQGIICIGGYLPSTNNNYSVITEEDIVAANGLKVFIAHGKTDGIIDIKRGKSAKNKLQKAGFDVRFYTYPEGHTITEELLSEIITWIKSNE